MGSVLAERLTGLGHQVVRRVEGLFEWLGAAPGTRDREATVREQNRQFAALFDAMTDSLLLVSPDGHLIYANRAALDSFEAATGLPSERIVGRHFAEIGFPPAFVRQLESERVRVVAGEQVRAERLFPTPNGSRWRESVLSPVYGADGKVEAITLCSRDIHDHKAAVARLQLLSKMSELVGALDYEDVLSAMARLSIPELADCCIVDVIENGRFRRAKAAHRDPAKVPLAEGALAFVPENHGWRLAEVTPGVQSLLFADYNDEMLRQMVSSPEPYETFRCLAPRSVLVVPSVVLGVTVAVTTFVMTADSGRRYGPEDRALAEELARRAAQIIENARLHRQLQKSEERFRIALANSETVVFEQDAALRYRWIYNPSLLAPHTDVVGRSDADLFDPEVAERLTALKRRVLATGEGVHQELDTSVSGERRVVLAALDALRDAAGAVVGLTGAATDITAAKRVQDELAQALAFREQMMGILGHDLRNPLSAVCGLAGLLLLRGGELPEDVRSHVAHIDQAAKRMVEMIATLLDFTESRFKGGLPISPQPTDLAEVCRGVVDELRAARPGRAIELAVQGEVCGQWDPARMAQVVSNLVGNALTYGAEDAPVRVALAADDADALLQVHNRGPVIPAQLIPVLFKPFQRGADRDGPSQPRGLGLGLYIVEQVVCAHGGSIAVTSTSDEGTQFTVRLPLAR